jgi:molybdenum cofactor biosynthesis protein MoaC
MMILSRRFLSRLTHLDADGRARMVDISQKAVSVRTATASGRIQLSSDTVKLLRSNAELVSRKGNVLAISELAGIQAAKHTSQLIPLCHPLQLTHVSVKCAVSDDGQSVNVVSNARCTGQTGVEMEALTAVSVACLTVYDMCKAVDKNMRISDIKLIEKTK